MIRRYVSLIVLCTALAGCASGPPRFKVPRDQFDRQVRSIALSPSLFTVSQLYLFEKIDDKVGFAMRVKDMVDARIQLVMSSTNCYQLCNAARCQTVEDSITQELSARDGGGGTGGNDGQRLQQRIFTEYLGCLQTDAILFVSFTSIADTKSRISPYRDPVKQEKGYAYRTSLVNHLILKARLADRYNNTLWDNSVMVKRELGNKDTAGELFTDQRIDSAVKRLLADLTKKPK
jgi:hypothetical protein